MTAIWVGSEDLEYVQMGGAVLDTTSGRFRSSMGSRCALEANGSSKFWESITEYNQTAFWFSARHISSVSSNNINGNDLLQFLDDDLLQRIRIRGAGNYDWKVYTVNAAGTAVQIGNTFFYPISITANELDKIDIYLNYDVAGAMDIYINGIHVFAFIGDLTTNGVTELCRHRLGGGPVLGASCWSETWIDDEDTRSQSLASWSPDANGNTNTFDTGSPSVGNISEVTLDVGTLNGSSVSGQIDQYTNLAVPDGTLDVKDVIISAYVQRGTSGPSKLALGVRTNGTNYWGTDRTLTLAWDNIQEFFPTNPDTTDPWVRNEIGDAIGFNVGSKSAA